MGLKSMWHCNSLRLPECLRPENKWTEPNYVLKYRVTQNFETLRFKNWEKQAAGIVLKNRLVNSSTVTHTSF